MTNGLLFTILFMTCFLLLVRDSWLEFSWPALSKMQAVDCLPRATLIPRCMTCHIEETCKARRQRATSALGAGTLSFLRCFVLAVQRQFCSSDALGAAHAVAARHVNHTSICLWGDSVHRARSLRQSEAGCSG